MEYKQIVLLLVVALLIYYAVIIALDIQKEKARQAAGLDACTEEDIDISDEAQTFQPVRIFREEKVNPVINTAPPDYILDEEPLVEDIVEEQPVNDAVEPTEETSSQSKKKTFVYREAVMTDGISVENLIDEVDKIAETGTSDLGAVIFSCDSARMS